MGCLHRLANGCFGMLFPFTTGWAEEAKMKQTGGLKRSPTETINSYITDMLALEEHMEKAVSGQIQALGDHPRVGADLRTIRHWIHIHIANLEQLTRTRKAATATGSLKRTGSSVLGRAAGAIDFLRQEGQPRNLRDDYTAFSLAAIGYVMLNTTALALGEREVADIAAQHLQNYARGMIALHYVIPTVVVRSLQKEGLAAREDILTEVFRNVEKAWSFGKAVRTHTAGRTAVGDPAAVPSREDESRQAPRR